MPNEGSGNLTIGGHVSESVLITGSHNVIVLERAAAQARAAQRDPARMLRILAVLAAPVHDPQRPQAPPEPLDLHAEWRRLEQAVRGAQAPILLARLTPPTLDALRRQLSPRAAEQGLFPQVLHFSGHAWAQGLLLEDEYGQVHPVSVAELLQRLQPPRPLDLVVLNACETAAEACSVAQALVGKGLARAAVGHPRPVRDNEAIAFARTLYADLTDGYPLRDAVANAERHLTTHRAVWLGDGDLRFSGLVRGEPVIGEGRPRGNLPPGESGDRVGFFGRGAELVRIAQRLERPPAIVVLTGPQGIGKSHLALEAAHRNAWRFSDGVAYAQAPQETPAPHQGQTRTATAAHLLNQLAQALGLEVREEAAEGEEDLVARVQQALLAHAKPTLFVLDNLETLPAAEMQRLADFLGQLGGGSAALVTLRPPQPALENLAQALTLPLHHGLAQAAAVRYALTLAQRKHIRLAVEEAQAIAQATAGHPLLIKQIVSQANHRDRQALLAEVRSHRGDFAEQIEAVYAWSAKGLSEAGRRAWQALPLFPAGWVPEAPLRALAGEEGTQALRKAAVADFDPRLQGWRWHPTAAEYAARHWPLSAAERRERLSAALPGWTDWLRATSDLEETARHARLEAALPNLEPLLALSRHAPREAAWAFLDALDDALPDPDRTLLLRAVQEPLYRQLADLAPDEAHQARAKGMLGYTLSALGRHEEALQATQEAVEHYRQLAAQNPQTFRPYLAHSLNNLGAMLSDLGRHQEALQATQEAVDIYRKLAEQNPQAFLPHLATSLNNLGNRLAELGRHQEALQAAQEAVAIRRDLAAQNPHAFLPDLAASLHNLGNILSALGRHQEALAATQEAVAIRRDLAAQNPQAFLPDLAGSLNNLGNILSALGRHQEALAATQEAVAMRRKLAAQNPQAFLPDLAMSLNNLGVKLSNLGRHQEALAATQEAVEHYRELAAQNPQAFRPHLAGSLNNLGAMLSNLSRHQEALAATQEAVDIRRQLAAQNPQAFRPDLAMSLTNLGNRLAALGRHQEALEATQEAVEHYRQLAAQNSQAILPELARSLGVHGRVLLALERPAEAAAALHEGLEALLPSARALPRAHGRLLGILLEHYLYACKAAGQEPEMTLVLQVLSILGASGGGQ